MLASQSNANPGGRGASTPPAFDTGILQACTTSMNANQINELDLIAREALSLEIRLEDLKGELTTLEKFRLENARLRLQSVNAGLRAIIRDNQ